MKSLVTGHCRDTLVASDVDFILAATCAEKRESDALQELLCDAHSRDVLLDDPALMAAIMDRPEYVHISMQLFFYLVVRHSLRRASLDDRDVADYIASMMTSFAAGDRMLRPLPYKDFATEWAVDLLGAISEANEEEEFLIRTHLANYALFMTGVFPERIEHRRDRHAAPGLSYYESMGRMSFLQASQCRLAHEYELRRVFELIAAWFGRVRVAMNEMCKRILFVGGPDATPLLAS